MAQGLFIDHTTNPIVIKLWGVLENTEATRARLEYFFKRLLYSGRPTGSMWMVNAADLEVKSHGQRAWAEALDRAAPQYEFYYQESSLASLLKEDSGSQCVSPA